MPDVEEIQHDYRLALDVLQAMAQRDLIAAWRGIKTEAWIKEKARLTDGFVEIVDKYGEQAAASAADYVFLQRSLDDDLSLLAYPTLGEPVDFDRARANAEWALSTVKDKESPEERAQAEKRLSAISQRLILERARNVVATAASESGKRPVSTKVLRRLEKRGLIQVERAYSLPSPGSCAWCLLIASKGDVFHKDHVGGYHDGCRCVPMLASDKAPVPVIIRQIELMQGQARELDGYEDAMTEFRAKNPNASDWQVWHKELDFAVKQQRRYLREFQEFPPIPGITIPDIDFTTVTYRDLGGELRTIDAPMIHQLAGHVLYGWKAEETELKFRMLTRRGHVGKLEEGLDKAVFRDKWSDQRVIDAVYEALADEGDWVAKSSGGRIKIMKEVAVPAPELMNEEKARNRRDFEVVVLKFYLDDQGRAYGLTAHPDKAALQREKRRRRTAAEGKDGVL